MQMEMNTYTRDTEIVKVKQISNSVVLVDKEYFGKVMIVILGAMHGIVVVIELRSCLHHNLDVVVACQNFDFCS